VGAKRVDLIRAATDRVRLEVAIAEGREINAWPGASQFDSRDVDQLVSSGPVSTGGFGTLLRDLFDNPGAQIRFAAEKTVEGRRVFRYTYTIPLAASHYQVRMIGGMWWNTPYSGDFEIAADQAELTPLNQDTGTLSIDSGMCRAETGIDCHFEKVGDGGFLIPRQGFERFAGRSIHQPDRVHISWNPVGERNRDGESDGGCARRASLERFGLVTRFRI
jgi:hypothetical protein